MPITSEPKGAKPPLVGLVKIQQFYQQVLTGNPTLKAANVLHIRWSDNTNHSLADLTTLASTFDSQWTPVVQPILASTASQIGVTVTSLGGDGLSASLVTSRPGTDSGEAIPPQCAVAITWKAAVFWRGGKPRTYCPFVTENMTASSVGGGSQLASAHTSALATRADTFITQMSLATIGGANPIVGFPSYFSKGAFRIPPIFFPFATAVVHDRMDSQRRRSGKESFFPID